MSDQPPYTWWPAGLRRAGAALGVLGVQWYNAARTNIGATATSTVFEPFVTTALAGAAYARPFVRFAGTGTWTLGRAHFAVGDRSAELLAGASPPGEGTYGYTVTRYTNEAHKGNGLYRDLTLELVEVTNAAG
ncbi:hypothetical protein ACFCWB_27795 [Streptomyces bacillaris]|uniref:hypothetical protein n=1 Tax=Streptomyces bacillaris TaxID=68179 RepID=UPI0035DE0DC8